jgi:hypothetical protein
LVVEPAEDELPRFGHADLVKALTHIKRAEDGLGSRRGREIL